MYRRSLTCAPVTVQDLKDILTAPSNGTMAFPSRSYDEVYPGIIIGDAWAAVDLRLLRMLGVTGVLNSCYGSGQPYLLDTDTEYYRRRGLEAAFLGLRAADAEWFPLLDWFSTAADFIQRAVRNGRVLVHCVQGLSRSATLVVAYLMIKQHMSVCQALRTVRARREIFPNDGFLQQLCRLDEQLQRRR